MDPRVLKIQPGILVGGVFAIGVLNTVHYAGLLVTGTNLLTIVPIQQVAVANLFGGTLMMAYLHRALGSEEPSDGTCSGDTRSSSRASWRAWWARPQSLSGS